MNLTRDHSRRASYYKVGCVFALAVALAWLLETRAEQSATLAADRQQPEELAAPPAEWIASFDFVGTASCAASNCHGGVGTRPTRNQPRLPTGVPLADPWSPKAYSIWIQQDPHARAYSTLLSETSVAMGERLGLPQAPHEAPACLSCHSPLPTSRSPLTNQPIPHDGVACESCHGAAGRWLEPHKRDRWRSLDAVTKQQEYGFRNTDDLLGRARLCASCHVGDSLAGRDVNHTLLAAGHPRLSFELSAYHANLPKHWSGTREPSRQTLDADLWLTGQVVCAEASLELLQHRADQQEHWPEFAEYGCFDCHHQLVDPSWRQRRRYLGGRPGSLAWGTWYLPLLGDVAGEVGQQGRQADIEQQVAKIRAEMSHPWPAWEHAVSDVQRLQAVLAELRSTATGAHADGKLITGLLTRLTDPKVASRDANWDATAQRYLAVTALWQALPEPFRERRAEVATQLQEISRLLAFPRDDAAYQSPRDYHGDVPEQITQSFTRIHAAVNQR